MRVQRAEGGLGARRGVEGWVDAGLPASRLPLSALPREAGARRARLEGAASVSSWEGAARSSAESAPGFVRRRHLTRRSSHS